MTDIGEMLRESYINRKINEFRKLGYFIDFTYGTQSEKDATFTIELSKEGRLNSYINPYTQYQITCVSIEIKKDRAYIGIDYLK